MPRDLRIDTIRGLLLVLITLNHSGNWAAAEWWVHHVTWQPLGYVSAAEGFVFVSGFMFARVSAPSVAHPAVLWQAARRRACHIYIYHLFLLFGLAASFLVVPLYRSL